MKVLQLFATQQFSTYLWPSKNVVAKVLLVTKLLNIKSYMYILTYLYNTCILAKISVYHLHAIEMYEQPFFFRPSLHREYYHIHISYTCN